MKKILVFILTAIMVFSCSSFVFAEDTSYPSIDVETKYSYYFVAYNNNNGWYLYINTTVPCYINGTEFVFDGGGYLQYTYRTTFWDIATDEENYRSSIISSNYSDLTFLESNYDIVDTDGTVFFQKTPLPQVLGVEETVMERVLTPQTILKMTGGLASFLIPSVLLFLAFRKGWKMLSMVLRRA